MEERSRLRAWVRALWHLTSPGSPPAPPDLAALLGPRAFERLFRAFVAHPDGQALLAERSDLAEALSEDEELLALPAGSLGRACAGRVPVPAYDRPDSLRLALPTRFAPAPTWFAARLRVLPGLWRVLAGFEEDAELLACCGGALREPGIGALLILAALLGPWRGWWRTQRARLAAWRCGRDAVPLLVIPYESLLPCSLPTVRRSLRIEGRPADGIRAVTLAHHEIRGMP